MQEGFGAYRQGNECVCNRLWDPDQAFPCFWIGCISSKFSLQNREQASASNANPSICIYWLGLVALASVHDKCSVWALQKSCATNSMESAHLVVFPVFQWMLLLHHEHRLEQWFSNVCTQMFVTYNSHEPAETDGDCSSSTSGCTLLSTTGFTHLHILWSLLEPTGYTLSINYYRESSWLGEVGWSSVRSRPDLGRREGTSVPDVSFEEAQ